MDTAFHNQIGQFVGVWRLDADMSAYQFGQPPASGVYTITYDGERLHFLIEWTTADGKEMRTTVQAIPDGMERPYEAPGVDAVCYTLVDVRTLDSIAYHSGDVVAYARRVLSDDGSTMVITQSGRTTDGSPFSNVSVYRRD